MQQQALDGLERRLLDVLVGAVHRVPGLEPDHGAPAALGEGPAGVGGIERKLGEGGHGATQQPHVAADQEVSLRIEVRHPGMPGVGRPENESRLLLFGGRVHLPHLEEAEARPVGCRERHGAAEVGGIADAERDRHRPGQAAGEAHLVDHALIVGQAQEAGERAVAARRDQLEIRRGSRVERDRRHPRQPLEQPPRFLALTDPVHQRAAVRCDRGHL